MTAVYWDSNLTQNISLNLPEQIQLQKNQF